MDQPASENSSITLTVEENAELKRKDLDPIQSQSETPLKKLKTDSIVKTQCPELLIKNNKACFTEKKLNFRNDPSTIQDMAAFHSWSSSLTETKEIPAEFYGMFGKLVQDSDATIFQLVKDLSTLLCPETFEKTNLVNADMVKQAILNSADRVNYGFKAEKDYSNLAIWRWETRSIDEMPLKMKETLLERRAKRTQVREAMQGYVNGLSEEEKIELFTKKGRSKTSEPLKTPSKPPSPPTKTPKTEPKKLKSIQNSASKQKGLQSITGFFKKVEKIAKPAEFKSVFEEIFHPFHLKQNAWLAPVNRFYHQVDLVKFDNEIKLGVADGFDWFTCKSESRFGLKKWKVLHFAQDYRPAYYGTWSKTSKLIKGKKPFVMDSSVLDYDYDSEAEWEEEEEGEDVNSDEEEEENEEEENEEENWVVPHGYLSDDEGVDLEKSVKSRFCVTLELERQQLEPLQPIIIGPMFSTSLDIMANDPMEVYRIQFISHSFGKVDPFEQKEQKPAAVVEPKFQLTDLIMDDIKALIASSSNGLSKLVDELKEKYPLAPKSQLESAIRKVAVREKRGTEKARWHLIDAVPSQVLLVQPKIFKIKEASPTPTQTDCTE